MTDQNARHQQMNNPLSLDLEELNTRSGPPQILPEGQSWDEHRAVIERTWREFIGTVDEPGSGRLTMREKSVEEGQLFELWTVDIDGGEGGPVPAQVLVPTRVLTSDPHSTRAPAVIACHPTHPEGKAAVTTEAGERRRPYGLELARRGYVVIAPDCLPAGERIYAGYEAYRTGPFYREHPDRTIVARTISDHQSALNALCALPFVDAERIGAIGHSLGGYNAYFLAGLDHRVRAVVSSCGFAPFRHDPRPGRWGQRDWYTHLPAVTEELDRGMAPFEFAQIAALMAPAHSSTTSGRPMLFSRTGRPSVRHCKVSASSMTHSVTMTGSRCSWVADRTIFLPRFVSSLISSWTIGSVGRPRRRSDCGEGLLPGSQHPLQYVAYPKPGFGLA